MEVKRERVSRCAFDYPCTDLAGFVVFSASSHTAFPTVPRPVSRLRLSWDIFLTPVSDKGMRL